MGPENQFQLDLAVISIQASITHRHDSFTKRLFALRWEDNLFETLHESDFCAVLDGIDEDDYLASVRWSS